MRSGDFKIYVLEVCTLTYLLFNQFPSTYHSIYTTPPPTLSQSTLHSEKSILLIHTAFAMFTALCPDPHSHRNPKVSRPSFTQRLQCYHFRSSRVCNSCSPSVFTIYPSHLQGPFVLQPRIIFSNVLQRPATILSTALNR
jgi:hypothetical protein